MAKYNRFDPRNKKRGKHKSQSIEKDLRIREVEDDNYRKYGKAMLHEIVYTEDDWEEKGLYE